MSNQTVPFDWTPYFVCQRIDEKRQPEMLNLAYALRYEVYCLDCHFLPAENYPNDFETDAFDEQSMHFCANNLRDEMVGYVRLVTARENHHAFPYERHCQKFFPYTKPPRQESAEISRLIVRRDYRRRRSDILAGVTIQTHESDGREVLHDRRKPPQILLGLYRQMYMYSNQSGIRYWYAAMERPLARALRQLGFGFKPISPEMDYYGKVASYLADLRQIELHLEGSNPMLLSWFQQETS